MAGGLFSRLKTWIGKETIKSDDLNAEFNNIISHLNPASQSGYEATVSQMREQTSPGGVGTESQASSLADEIKRERYQLNAIIGGPNGYWYESPPASITSLNNSLQSLFTIPANRIISGRIDANNQPMFLVPAGSSNSVSLKATSTNFLAYLNSNLVTFNSDLSLTGLTTAPAATNTCLVNDASLAGGQSTRTQGELGTSITIGTIGASITALNGKYAAFKNGTEYFIAEIDTTNTKLKNCLRGVGFNSSDTWLSRQTLTNGATITLMQAAWLFATYNSSVQGLDVTYNKPKVQFSSPSGPSVGDYWYDITNAVWKKYNGTAFVSQTAVFIGLCILDTSNVVAARSADFFKPYNQLNTIELEYFSTSQVRCNRISQRASVYGVTRSYDYDQPIWSTSTDLDSGVALSTNTKYFAYLTDGGNVKLSDVAPYERKYDLLGAYHPAKPWRAVGEFQTDGSSNITSSTVNVSLYHQSILADAEVINRMMAANSVTTTNITDLNVTYAKINDGDVKGKKVTRNRASKTSAYPIVTDDDFVYAPSGGPFTFTLPAVSTVPGRVFTLKRSDSDITKLYTIARNGSDTFDRAATTLYLATRNESYTLLANELTNQWETIHHHIDQEPVSFTPTGTFNTNITYTGFWERRGARAKIRVHMLFSGGTNATTAGINMPSGMTIDTARLASGSAGSSWLGDGSAVGGSVWPRIQVLYSSTTDVGLGYINSAGSGSPSTSASVSNTAPTSWAAGHYITVEWEVPIVNWLG